MSHKIRDQFVQDMQMAGLAPSTQARYLKLVDRFFKSTWLTPHAVTERDVQAFLADLRTQDVARETFRGYRYALQALFVDTLDRDWALFKKNSARPPSNVCHRS